MASTLIIIGLCAIVQTTLAVNPVSLWPLNSRYGSTDIIGGKNGAPYNTGLDSNNPLDLSSEEENLPDALSGVTSDQTYLFSGNSYLEMPTLPMVNDFTVVAFVKPLQDGPIFQWHHPQKWGDHLWVNGNKLFARPDTPAGIGGTALINDNLVMGSWNLVGLSYQRSTGRGILHANGEKEDKSGLMTPGAEHGALYGIRMGQIAFDSRSFRGNIACAALFDTFITDLDDINWDMIVDKCFEREQEEQAPEYCNLAQDAGNGSGPTSWRYYFDGSNCKKFKYSGKGGNENNFESKAACAAVCK